MNERTKSRFELVVTSYGRNKNLDEIKKTKRRPIIAPAIAVRLLINSSKQNSDPTIQQPSSILKNKINPTAFNNFNIL